MVALELQLVLKVCVNTNLFCQCMVVSLCCGECRLSNVCCSCESVLDVANVLKLVELRKLVEQLPLDDGNLLLECGRVLLCLSQAVDVECESA